MRKMIFSCYGCPEAEGVVLAHTLHLPNRTIKKGKTLTADDLADIQHTGFDYVTGVRLAGDDVDEDRAAVAVAEALAGAELNSSLTIGKPMGGRCNLYAKSAGVAAIDPERINRINLSDGAITVATLPEYAETVPGQAVASIKVIPFAVSQKLVDLCVELAQGDTPAVALKAYRPRKAALILTEAPGLKASVLDSTRRVTEQRLAAMGSCIVSEQRCAHAVDAVSVALRQALVSDCDMVLICGATVTVDTGDIVPSAIVREGGEIDHFGMPVEPGNMLLLAHCGSRTIINLPGCSRSPKLNGLDWVLQRTLADISVSRRDIQLMGVGGLIKDIPHVERVKKQRSLSAVSGKSNQSENQPRIAAVILAAGRSSRMGEQNKLLAAVGEAPMVAHVAEVALVSDAEQVIVVTGHEAEQVQQALAAIKVGTVFNPDYASGMASSLRRGLEAVSQDMDGAMILLGDMPFVGAREINELIAEFNPHMERDIVAPFRKGRRGNPVLWARRYFPAMMALSGDTGARGLLKEHAANVWDVPVSSDAVFADFDTPEALASIEEKMELMLK